MMKFRQTVLITMLLFGATGLILLLNVSRDILSNQFDLTKTALQRIGGSLKQVESKAECAFQPALSCHLSSQLETVYSVKEQLQTIPTLYLVTPTNTRIQQKADLTRLSYTLRLVPNLHWILIEDSENKTALVSRLLSTSHLSYTHLNVITPKLFRNGPSNKYKYPRGNAQRNAGLAWLRTNARTPGVVYFADDDNTYDIRLFEEMRYTQKVSVWPVGFISRLKYGTPICKNGKVIDWLIVWAQKRVFATDMAGFAVNVQLLHDNPRAHFTNIRGYIETNFLEQLHVKREDLEPRANNCTQVLVWHTRTAEVDLVDEPTLKKMFGQNVSRDLEV